MNDESKVKALRKELEQLDRQLARMESRRAAIVTQIHSYERDWNPVLTPTILDSISPESSTMARVRHVLASLGREATVAEIRAAILKTFQEPAATSLTTMLHREGSRKKSGIYRATGTDRIGKYGLLKWLAQGNRGSKTSKSKR
jgi:chorismate mutase